MATLTVEQYHAMIDRGILGPEDRVELLQGVLVEKMPKKTPHSAAKRRSKRTLEKLVGPDWTVDEQEPVTLTDSEPEPDLVVIRASITDYLDHHPGPADIGLVIEIADSSLVRDRTTKKAIYAQAGIPFYWIIDLQNHSLEVYSQPAESDYRQVEIYGTGDRVSIILDAAVIGEAAVSELLP